MKKILNTILILLITMSISFAVAPISAQLSNIEKSLFGVEYKKESEAQRIKRIEKQVYGEEYKEKDIQKRINKINETLGLEGSEEDIEAIKKEVDNIQAKGVSYPAIDRLENHLLGRTYDGEGVYSRVERLEKKVFNSKQDGDLNQRVERLSATISENDPTVAYEKQNTYNDWQYNKNDVMLQISGLEQSMFRKTYEQDPLEVRLNRLERKIFQRDFSSDDVSLRIQRIQAAATATRTAKYYDGNKFQKVTSTGLQIGSFVLMILALIL